MNNANMSTATKRLKFTYSEIFGVTQYVYLGFTAPRQGQTFTRRGSDISVDGIPRELTMDNIYNADERGLALGVVLVNKDGYNTDDVYKFATLFNQRSSTKKITKVIDNRGLMVERSMMMN